MNSPSSDPWRLDEWEALEDRCFIAGCDSYEIDFRGPIFLIDKSMHKACVQHWQAIMFVLGEQFTWQSTDAYIKLNDRCN